MKIAWIGLGHMGGPMSMNLVAAGHEVTGYDVNPEAVSAAEKHGVQAAQRPGEAVEDADAVFTMLPSGNHVRAVYEGKEGVLAAANPTAILIDSSTIDVATTLDLSAMARQHGLRFIDAPVSGGVAGAIAGELTFMIGGEMADVDAVRPVIDVMAGRIFHIGGAGQGQAAKIVNNMMAGINLVALCEGAVLAARLGIDASTMYDLACVSTGDSWSLRNGYPIAGVVPQAAVNRGFAPGFAASLMAKDIGLAVDAAHSVGLDVPAATLALAEMTNIVEQGMGGLDCTVLVRSVNGERPEGAT